MEALKAVNPVYGTYRLTLTPFNGTPQVELLYSSENSEECIQQAHFMADEYYKKHSSYSPNMGIIPLKTKFIVFNLVSFSLDIFYASRRNSV